MTITQEKTNIRAEKLQKNWKICHFYVNTLAYITLMPTCEIRPKMEDIQRYEKSYN